MVSGVGVAVGLLCLLAGPWAGIVRLEAALALDLGAAVALANATQVLLPVSRRWNTRTRAPQNLVPIAGLERDL